MSKLAQPDPARSAQERLETKDDPRLRPGELALISATVLFLELALIRWGGAQVRVLAYFPNLLLIGSFLGLGIGCLCAGRRSFDAWWMPALLLFAAVSVALSRIAFTQRSVEEHLWLLYYDLPKDAPVIENVWAPVIACFALSVLAFIPPGQMVAERLRRFQHAGRGLTGYGWDLGGSVLGTAIFALASFLGLKPLHWFALAVATSTVLVVRSRHRLILHLGCGALLLLLIHGSERADVYSPYYALSTTSESGNIHILANRSLHQVAISTALNKTSRKVAAGYHLPFTSTGHKPRRALVLGAGSGNDVATLLQEGAESIDAVEIDPAIIELGRKLHPNRPYDSPRVRIINTDARAFLNDTDGRYDTIVFGTLDSMTRLSALSNVRLDNFVYTTECLAAARRHLTADGALILYFMAAHSGIELRLAGMLTRVFGEPPVIHHEPFSLFNVIYLAGPAFRSMGPEQRALPMNFPWQHTRQMLLPTDDWPFLYLESPRVGHFYLIVMAWIAVLALAGVALASREFRRNLVSFKGADAPMLLFGLAFLLLETRAVTAMNLVWGSTWFTSAVVFGAILLTVLLGTLVFARWPVSLAVSIAGLSVSLLGLYLMPSEWLLTMSLPTRLALSLMAVGLPVFFASTGFACIYNSRPDVGHAFGWNLLGAVAGGLCEFLSMITGLRALLLLALVAYFIAYLLERRRTVSRSGKQPELA